jgi:AraC family transcriptional regulator
MTRVAVVEVIPHQIISLRRQGRYEEIGPMLAELFAHAAKQGLQIVGPPVFICRAASPEECVHAHDDGMTDLEVAFPIAGDAREEGGILVYELPGGTMARIIHLGPYRDMVSALNRLFDWLAANGKTVTGPVREVYHNSPQDTPEDELVTWIYAPID